MNNRKFPSKGSLIQEMLKNGHRNGARFLVYSTIRRQPDNNNDEDLSLEDCLKNTKNKV